MKLLYALVEMKQISNHVTSRIIETWDYQYGRKNSLSFKLEASMGNLYFIGKHLSFPEESWEGGLLETHLDMVSLESTLSPQVRDGE